MKRFLVSIGMIAAVVMTGCDQQSNSGASQQQKATSSIEKSKPAFQSYGEKGVANTWPPMVAQDLPKAENLTASNYYIVVDGSGSMAERKCSNNRNKMTVAKEAIQAFIEKLPSEAQVGLFAFDSRSVGERLSLGSHAKRKAIDVVNSLRAGGGTPLSTSIEGGVRALTTQGVRQLGYGEYHLVVVTDGQASGGYSPDKEVNQLLEGTPIVLHTIGFCIDSDHSLNRPGYTIYKGANNPSALMAGLDSVLAEAPSFDVSAFEGAQ